MKAALAVRIAHRFAGSYPLAGTYHEQRFADQAPGLVARASERVESETGLRAPGDPTVTVAGRIEWVEANIESFGRMLAPAEEQLKKRTSAGLAAVAEQGLSVELGAVLGMLSRRVLGQYELVLPADDGTPGDTVFFVGANVLWMERQFEFRPDEFRFWVALHECTHRLQFVGVPWMRDYFLSLVQDIVRSSKPDTGRLKRVLGQARSSAREGQPVVDEMGLLGLFASPAQRTVIEKVQALMCLLEGHGHVIMDRVGARELVTQGRMSRVLKARRKDPRTQMFMRLVGLEMKMKQYELGEKFIQGVERHAGWSTLDLAWHSPDKLPTLEEIGNPVLWLNRVA